MSLTIDHNGMAGKIVLDTESRGYPFLRAYPSHEDDRYASHAYLGFTAQDDLLALGKAILNAVEPEALVENQKEAEPEPYRVEHITPTSAPTPSTEQQYDIPALVAAVADLEDRIAALEADTEIRVGDTVRVEPDDWNIGGSWVGHEVKTGKVVWVADENYRGRSKYLVSVTHPDGYTNSVYALKATKVVSRG